MGTELNMEGYLRRSFEPDKLQATCDRASDFLRALNKKTPFDAVAVSGFGGLVVGGAVSYRTGIPLIGVRKEADRWHGATSNIMPERYVILDDLISTGYTCHHAVQTIRAQWKQWREIASCMSADPARREPPEPRLVGVALYSNKWLSHYTLDNRGVKPEFRDQAFDLGVPVYNIWCDP